MKGKSVNDYYQDPNGQDEYQNYRAQAARRTMSTASFVLGLIAVLTFQFFFISLPAAGASIILALLSRSGPSMMSRSRIALMMSGAAVTASLLFTWYAVSTVYKSPELRAQVQQLYDYYTGNTQSPSSESGETAEDPQQLLHDILSGDYRARQQEGQLTDPSTNLTVRAGGSVL